MRKDRPKKSSATEIASDIQRGVQMLDKPQAERPRHPRDCNEHAFILRDRCFWCGAPDLDQQPILPNEPLEEAVREDRT